MVQNVAGIIAELESEDIYLLSGLEQGMRFSEWVQKSKLPEFAGLTPEEVDYRIDRCLDRELIERKTIQYEGYRLKFEGYDALALHTFAERETIDGVGTSLGVGKESDVYEARSYRPLALKYHREGITEFREVNRERNYTADHEHVSWMYTARKAAEQEYAALQDLYPEVSVPRPIDHNRHAIVMEKMTGVELSQTQLDDDQVLPVLSLIIEELAAAYQQNRVHADISEYNIFISEDGITIFDWPQSVSADHANAPELLERDLENIIGYFSRKYPNNVENIDVKEVKQAVIDDEFTTVEACQSGCQSV
ncbi:serine/threonine protein phosphatase [Salinarchaeum sp. IM2453]|uniref:serine/threonine-protein kinase RIO2 n=1 Tax=Salinarchaeum sp. IM2453 TaxID=2862870 RepID=UPI001C83A36A|nr:RIO1 family regulatory kinase/ATPase [Salinarchaeum sp. IM2453]QZA87526.1 serine/threonine protein phosphatase [Salinarchaeum sp. IM2453]